MKKLQLNMVFLLFAFPLIFLMSACGIRPDGVSSPAGIENDTFPNTYPDNSTDPD